MESDVYKPQISTGSSRSELATFQGHLTIVVTFLPIGDMDNRFNPIDWSTETNIPQGGASVTEQNGRMELVQRGPLLS